MLRATTPQQFDEWMLYEQLEPFGELRDDFRMANTMQLIANVYRDTKKKQEPYTLQDFLFDFDGTLRERKEVQRKQTPEYIQRVIEGWILVNNIVVERGEKTQ